MILCAHPESLLTWNYRVLDGANVIGTTHYTVFGESGEVTAEGRRLSIERQGPVSGEWRLIGSHGEEISVARKVSLFTRRMEMTWGEVSLVSMEGAHPFTRRMIVEARGHQLGEIAPKHLFTRQATLDFREEVPLEIRLFCLWLAVLLWRRANNSNSGASGN